MRTIFRCTPRTGVAAAIVLAAVLGGVNMAARAVDNRATSNLASLELFRREITLPKHLPG